MKTMTSSCDRTRLKDRIIANVAKAIKCIQESQILKGEDSLVLTNADWQCHKLCEHLDHAFLHGLRHVTHGYWKVVTEFTRKGAVQEITRLTHVTTDLGRARAWLYMALNENLLESYMRCFMENSRFVKKYYVKEALVLDQQRLNVLVTLTSGLDYGTFKLEYNVPYLDLSSYQARPKSDPSTAVTQNEDRVSLCSMESSSSQISSSMSSSMMSSDFGFTRGYFDEEFSRRRTLSASTDSGFQIEAGSTLLSSRHLSVPCDTSNNTTGSSTDSFTRLSRIESIIHVSDAEEGEDLEVIRVKSKGDHSKKKKKKLKKVPKKDRNSITERDESQVTDSNSLSRDDSTDNSRATPSDDDKLGVLPGDGNSHDKTLESSVEEHSLVKVGKDDSGYGLCEETAFVEDVTDSSIYGAGNNVDNEKLNHELHIGNTQAESKEINLNNDKRVSKTSLAQVSDISESSPTRVEISDPCLTNGPYSISPVEKSETSLNSSDFLVSASDSDNSNLVENVKAENSKQTRHSGNSATSEATNKGPDDQDESIYGDSIPKGQGSKVKSRSNPADEQTSNSIHVETRQEAGTDSRNTNKDVDRRESVIIEGGDKEKSDRDEQTEDKMANEFVDDCSVKVDNNSLLQLMLEVFESEEEQFVKLYSTRCGHTEGETTVIYLLVTDKALYILSQSKSSTFKKDTAIPYKELDYISVSMGHQVVQIVCTNRRKQFWITTGNSLLTECILKSISDVMEEFHSDLPKLTILTDATTQRIAMRKYAATETQTEPLDMQILCYVLVHWEDPSICRKVERANKEGHLLYKAKGINQSWKTAYMILRDGVFCLYNTKSDSKPHFFINLNSENCSGCRRLPSADRNHCLEIMVSKGSPLQLAAANNQEASAWLQVLCQAVSEGQQGSVGECRTTNCLPCCLVLTPQRILMCHEDVQTSFFRTLGSASVVDVTAITEDPFIKTYCVLEFESQDISISSNQWVLYFNAATEKNTFIEAFSNVWTEEFQVEVPLLHIQDVPLQTGCREMANYLRDSLKLK